MKRAIRLLCLASALVAPTLLTAAPAAAACGDRPAAGVDWSKCEKRRLVLRGQDLSDGKFLRTDFGRSDLAGAKFSGADLTERSEEHTSELQSLMRTSYAVFCLKKKKKITTKQKHNNSTTVI